MVIEKRIKLGNEYYFVGMEVKYIKKMLCKMDETCFDHGDIDIIIEKLEHEYHLNDKKYDDYIKYMNDVIYIYKNIPDLSYVKDVYYDKNNMIYSSGCIKKTEIEEYIKDNNIKISI